MASLTGSSPPPRLTHHNPFPCALGITTLILAACLASAESRAVMPDDLREALAHFNPEVAADWAYTQTTIRNDLATTGRFDPAKPPPERWTLLQYDRREPTPQERKQYRQFKEANPGTASQAAFHPEDIDPGSIGLVREDTERAVFHCRFREVAAEANKMLGHLSLQLTVNKRQPHIEKFMLALDEPYSPVLGVKMNSLTVEMSFSPPTAGQPSLPVVSSSRFTGRIFFIGVEENLMVSYSEYVRIR